MNTFQTIKHLGILLFTCLFFQVGIAQNCNPDTASPNAVCDANVIITPIPGEAIVIEGSDLNEGSNDNCTAAADLEFFVSQDLTLTSPPSTTETTFAAGTTGEFFVTLWVVDEAGLFNTCWVSINIEGSNPNCNPDVLGPTAICNSNVTIQTDPDNPIIIVPSDINENSSDNCTAPSDLDFFISDDPLLPNPPTTTELSFPAGTVGTFQVAVWVIDEAGLFGKCWTEVNIVPLPADCNPDLTAPIAICETVHSISMIPLIDFDITHTLLDDGSYDNCTSGEDLQFFITTDPTLTSPPSTEVLTIPSGTNDTITVFSWVVDEAGQFNTCATELRIRTFQFIQGQVFIDANDNCSLDMDEEDNGLGNFTIRYTLDQGLTYTTTTSSQSGFYNFSIDGSLNVSEIQLEVLLPQGISSSCPTSFTLPFPLDVNPNEINFPIQLATDCDNMMVDISSPLLRRCLPVNYTATYCNHSAYDIDNVELTVTLPAEMVVLNTGIPYIDLGNNQLLFDLGTVTAGFCGQIPITIVLDCTTPLGVTKCVQASIVPNDCIGADSNWSGASLVAEATCNEATGKVQLSITNEGNATMSEAQDFLIVEDVIMYMQDPIQLGPNETKTIEMDANGSTWRIEILQEAGHPSLSIPSAVVEGCGGFGSMGFINQFSLADVEPYLAIDCQEVIGSFDPNEKKAYPTGYTDEHYISPNTSIEYHLHFQNTGTDTAFTVRLEDRLSEHLDFTTVTAGAASHPYRMELQSDGLLIFHFEDIHLPDSTINEPASHGFVQFRVQQKLDQAIGTVIPNTVDIYFDFNDPIATNTVFHTLGEDVMSHTSETLVPTLELSIVPNPFVDQTLFTLAGMELETPQFELFDIFGRLVKKETFSGSVYELQRDGLPSGTYLYRFMDENQLLAKGKIIVH